MEKLPSNYVSWICRAVLITVFMYYDFWCDFLFFCLKFKNFGSKDWERTLHWELGTWILITPFVLISWIILGKLFVSVLLRKEKRIDWTPIVYQIIHSYVSFKSENNIVM